MGHLLDGFTPSRGNFSFVTTEQLTTCDGARLEVRQVGSGRPELLVLPGGPMLTPDYLGDLAGIGQDVPFVILSPRGVGGSSGRSRGWWLDSDDVAAVVTHLGLEQADVLGHSAGTRVALALATRHPQRVRRLVLVTPAAAWLTGTSHDAAAVAGRRPDQFVVAPALARLDDEPTSQAELDEYRRMTAPVGYAAWRSRERSHAAVGTVRFSDQQAFFQGIPDDVAAQVRQALHPPTLVVAGEEDVLSGVGPVRAYAHALGADLAWIAGCGHYPWVEQPARFREVVAGWLTGV